MKNKIIINKIQDSQKNDLLKTIYDSPEYAEVEYSFHGLKWLENYRQVS
jgi:hypothetical protein